MKFSEKKILEIARSFLKEMGIDDEHYKINQAVFDKKYKPRRGINKGKEVALWAIAIDDTVFDTTDFLIISDETGIPLYLQTKHGVTEIKQDADGKYVWKD